MIKKSIRLLREAARYASTSLYTRTQESSFPDKRHVFEIASSFLLIFQISFNRVLAEEQLCAYS